MNHQLGLAAPRTARLRLRPWRVGDAPAALRTYDHPHTVHGLSPSAPRVCGRTAMRALLEQWIADDETAPAGRWAIERRHDHRVIGGASLLPLPPGNDDLGLACQFDPAVVPVDDYVTEVAGALVSRAFDHYVDEVFAVVRPDDPRTAATVGRTGMPWVGETTKYFDLDLQVYRVRRADLVAA